MRIIATTIITLFYVCSMVAQPYSLEVVQGMNTEIMTQSPAIVIIPDLNDSTIAADYSKALTLLLADSLGIGVASTDPSFPDSLRFEIAIKSFPLFDYQWNRQSNNAEFIFNREHTGTRQNGNRPITWEFVGDLVETSDVTPPPNPRFFVFSNFQETSDSTATMDGIRVDNLIDRNILANLILLGTK